MTTTDKLLAIVERGENVSDWQRHANKERCQLADHDVATAVRMLTRSDLDHELVCVMSRDRIASLSRGNRVLAKALLAVQAELRIIAAFPLEGDTAQAIAERMESVIHDQLKELGE